MCRITHQKCRWIVAGLMLAMVLVRSTGCGADLHGTFRISSDPDAAEFDDPFELPPPAPRE